MTNTHGSQRKSRSKTSLFKRFALFRRDEDGGLIIFSIFIFILMLMAGGMAVDFMRFEAHRSVLQGTLDRAVLAAADIDQTLPPADVVQDYFDKAMIQAVLTDVQVTSGIGSREVTASAQLTNPSIFLTLMGIDEISAPAQSAAEETVPFLEVALVLDVSGSMGDNNRLVNLQDAATTFVNLVIPEPQNSSSAGLVLMSMVPYNMSVNMGARFSTEFNLTNEHTYSYCAYFDDAIFNATALNLGDTIQRHQHYDVRWMWSAGRLQDHPGYTNAATQIATPLCRRAAGGGTAEVNPIIPWQTDPTAIITAIDNFEAEGGTAIDDGMRWGVALVDPSLRPVMNSYISTGDASSLAAGFPQDYNINQVSKVVILMTDGQLDTEHYPRVDMRDGPTNVFYNPATDSWSVLVRGDIAVRVAPGNQDDTLSYRWIHLDDENVRDWPDTPLGAGFNPGNPTHWGELERLSWPDVHDRFGVWNQWWELFEPLQQQGLLSAAEINILTDPYGTIENTNADRATRMLNLCTLAKNEDILIYAIAMDSPNAAASQLMADCATSASTFFDVSTAEIEDVFATIAGDVTALRLVQ